MKVKGTSDASLLSVLIIALMVSGALAALLAEARRSVH
jgi:hypothetical protein